MEDYERYGDYNRDPDEPDEGPPPHPAAKFMAKLVRILLIVAAFSICGVLLFRIFYAEYYPKSVKQLTYTDALTSYCQTNGIPPFQTQEIFVPYEDSTNGWFMADNLIFSEEAGVLQCTVRINKGSRDDIAAAFSLEEFTIGEGAFRFVLENNAAYELSYPDSGENKPDDARPTVPATYEATAVEYTEKPLYYYIKLCFDGVTFQDVSWFRIKLYVNGAAYKADESNLSAIVVYEADRQSEPYRLSKEETVYD